MTKAASLNTLHGWASSPHSTPAVFGGRYESVIMAGIHGFTAAQAVKMVGWDFQASELTPSAIIGFARSQARLATHHALRAIGLKAL